MPKSNLKLFLSFFKFSLPYRKQWLWVLILSGLVAVLSLVNPYLIKIAIDEGINQKKLGLFIIIILIGGVVFLLQEILDGIRRFFEEFIRIRVNFAINKKLFRHIFFLSLNWFKDKSTGEHIYKIDNDISAVTDFITNTLPQAFYIFPKLLFILIILFYLDWRIALFSLILAPLLYFSPYYLSKKMKRSCEDLIMNSEAILKHLEENFSHIYLIKVFAQEMPGIIRYLKMLIENIRIRIKEIRLEIMGSFLINLSTNALVGIMVIFCGFLIIKGKLSLGTLTAIMVYLYQLMGLESQFASFFHNAIVGRVSCARITEVLDTPAEIGEVKGAKNLVVNEPKVVFEEVSFGYVPEKLILKNMSFVIKAKSHIVIAGPSGCGKTTLLCLLIRLYDCWEGEILIDGFNIKEVTLDSLRKQVGFSLQEPFLWNDTIENNIRYGKEDASREEINRVGKLCGVDEFINQMPGGYATVIGENACKISEGQKQKIAIARALIKKPKILILDEAMSSMEPASEEEIISNIKNNYPDLTLIIVSHRLSTVMNAELVYYFSRPNEMIMDKPKDLFKGNREFAHLFSA